MSYEGDMETLEKQSARAGAARREWWDWWIDRKTRWARHPVAQLEEGLSVGLEGADF